MKYVTTALLLVMLSACSGGNFDSTDGGNTDSGTTDGASDGGGGTDGGGNDGGSTDGGSTDGSIDGGSTDGSTDGGNTDGNTDGGNTDGGTDGGSTDGGTDGGSTDGGTDGGSTDGGTDGGSTDGSTDGGSTDGPVVSDLRVEHRSGQTFVTWRESHPSAHYHIYRSNQPIDSGNLSSATLLTSRWGPIDQNSSVHQFARDDVPNFFVIRDLDSPLSDDTGLFVHTTQPGTAGNAHYAVTTVLNGTENRAIEPGANTLATPISESIATPRPVLTVSTNGGKGRIYTQYMDYAQWNPTFNGYAFNYAVALPYNYDSSRAYSLQVELHAFGSSRKFVDQTEYDWQVIQLFLDDPGAAQGTAHTWWYGHAADHNYLTSGSVPRSGTIANFTEQRIVKAIDEVIADGSFNVDPELVHAYGNSMGASGSVSLAMRYPDVFAGIYASQPMTHYAANPLFQENLEEIWGAQSDNLPIVNGGLHNENISDYGADGTQPTGVWDWMNHQLQLRRRSGDEFAYLLLDFGKADTVLDWQTQGQPMFAALTDGKAAFSARALGDVGHRWMSFGASIPSLFGFGYSEEQPWRYPKSLSFPAIHNATGSGSLNPSSTGDDLYNQDIVWSTPRNAFHQSIVDSTDRWEITIRSMDSDQSADVTPRNTSAFNPFPGEQCSWSARRISDNAQTGGGNASADADGLVTAAQVPISSAGTRLVINCP